MYEWRQLSANAYLAGFPAVLDFINSNLSPATVEPTGKSWRWYILYLWNTKEAPFGKQMVGWLWATEQAVLLLPSRWIPTGSALYTEIYR